MPARSVRRPREIPDLVRRRNRFGSRAVSDVRQAGHIEMASHAPPDASLDEASDDELVRRARAGDRVAYGELVRRHQHAALRLAAAVCGSTEEARDIVQDALVKGYRSLDRFRGDAPVRSWLLRIVANDAKNAVRARVRRIGREERYEGLDRASSSGAGDRRRRAGRRARRDGADAAAPEPAGPPRPGDPRLPVRGRAVRRRHRGRRWGSPSARSSRGRRGRWTGRGELLARRPAMAELTLEARLLALGEALEFPRADTLGRRRDRRAGGAGGRPARAGGAGRCSRSPRRWSCSWRRRWPCPAAAGPSPGGSASTATASSGWSILPDVDAGPAPVGPLVIRGDLTTDAFRKLVAVRDRRARAWT